MTYRLPILQIGADGLDVVRPPQKATLLGGLGCEAGTGVAHNGEVEQALGGTNRLGTAAISLAVVRAAVTGSEVSRVANP